MNNYLSDKPRRPKAIDGILSSAPRRPKNVEYRKLKLDSTNVTVGSSSNGYRRPLLDDFNKSEGFRGRNIPRLSSGGDYEKPTQTLTRMPVNSHRKLMPIRGTEKRKHKKGRSKLRAVKRVALVMVVLVLISSGLFFGRAWWNAHKVFKGGGSALAFDKNIDPHLLKGEGDGRVNVLLIGKGGDGATGGQLTDSLLIVSIDPINTSVTLLSIPRDLWVKPQGLWPMKINAVYESAKFKAMDSTSGSNEKAAEAVGVAKLNSTIEQYLGVHMHYWGMIEFKAFEEVVNTIGGIDITLKESYRDSTMLVGNQYLYLPTGTQHVDGGHALAYARSRYGTARGDFDRGGHQQTVLMAIKDKVLTLGTYSNPIKVSQLLDTFGDRIQTNLSIDDMMRVYGISKQLNSTNTHNVNLAQEKDGVVTTGSVGDQSVVIPKAGANDYSEVKAFVRNKLKDGFIIKENPKIVVLNGSNVPGLAQKRADELKGYGYTISKVDYAPSKDFTSTQLIDNTKGTKKYTKRYLEQRLNTQAVNSIKGVDLSNFGWADYIIIVGPQG